MAVRRIQTKNNRVIYYDDNRKRIVKLKDWSRQFTKQIKPDVPENLSKREKQSLAANSRIRNNGRFINKRQENEVRSLLKKDPNLKLVNNDLTKSFGKEGAANILRRTFKRWVNNVVENQFSVDKEIIRHIKQGGAFKFIDKKGNMYFGIEAFAKLKEAEQRVINEAKKAGKNMPVVMFLFKEDTSDNSLVIEEEDIKDQYQKD
jgi:hypothetical protein